MSRSVCSLIRRLSLANTVQISSSITGKRFYASAAEQTTITSSGSTVWTPKSIRVGVLARKKGMTSIFNEDGERIPVTVLHLDNVQVTLVREDALLGAGLHQFTRCSVQVACSDRRIKTTTRQMLGHFNRAGVEPKYKCAEFEVTKDALLPVGATISADHFVPGQYIDITGISMGKGFQGSMKRHGFAGLPASHGVSVSHRSHGSTGQRQDPGRVFKGKKMAGRMGGDRVTVQNLEVVKIDKELNCVFVRGAVPGPDDGFVRMRDAIKLRSRKDALKSAFGGTLPPFPAALAKS